MLRVLTYNVRRCLGLDGDVSVPRIASVIASCRPDIIALQELDVRRARSFGVDQAQEIARELDMKHVHFHPALKVMEEEYGDAIITAAPSCLIKAGPLPGMTRRPRLEPRGALWVRIAFGGRSFDIVNTHLGLGPAERRAQAAALLGPAWLGTEASETPAILLGDFNSLPGGRVYRRLSGRFRDAYRIAGRRAGPRCTFMSRLPMLRLDYIFVDRVLSVDRIETVSTPLARVASDHLPLVADIAVAN
ncbi:MAG: endonuclease/exonuclease/phosphatase family protein [Rhodobiaceae bacterium]|nr:endonuclease/exonuclease/phosphatase family protein [Rhodobiaceae bacterium]MCC0056849.1 endonuclease/exonuclease/phosphatase family protein [Rhodobiaceae bacterium]